MANGDDKGLYSTTRCEDESFTLPGTAKRSLDHIALDQLDIMHLAWVESAQKFRRSGIWSGRRTRTSRKRFLIINGREKL